MTEREHGTHNCYVHGPDRSKTGRGCRCEPCRAANREYERQRAARIEPPYVSAGPARAHVHALQAAGVGLKQVAKASGVPHGSLSKLIYGDPARGMGPSKRIRPATAERILAVTPADAADGARVPAGPTWEHIDRLVAAGVPKRRIAERIGQRGGGLQLGRDTIQARHARAIAEMAAELDAGTLVTVRRSRHGDTELAPAGRDREAEARDEARRAAEARRRAIYRAAERDEAPPPLTYDDADQFLVELAEVLEARIDGRDWRASAACRGRPTWLWFPAKGDRETLDRARKVCRSCFVREQCLAANLDAPDGVYGGLSAHQRRELRREAVS